MKYISTRGGAANNPASATISSEAIRRGLAPDGGLYVPEVIPKITKTPTELSAMTYPQLAYEMLSPYLTDYPAEELRRAINAAYAYPARFSHPQIAPLKSCRLSGFYFLELFHGKTQAFKDMALSLLPSLLRRNEKTVILTATSGDTGKAALEAFADVPGVEIVVFYPQDGVSGIQKLQMTTQEGCNVHVVAVRGNFDDTQRGVKKIFAERNFPFPLSSANSINVGRLLPQIVYYFYAYGQLLNQGVVKPGEAVDFTVPTGNFGNILAGYYAKKMGLPVRKLVCASNQNNVLHQFFHTGEYDANRKFYTTMSPSMDILVSSNLERLLFHTGGDPGKVRDMMESLAKDGRFRFKMPMDDFESAFATEGDTNAAMRESLNQGYLCDPHTAVALHAANKFKQPNVPMVVIATASPYKFASSISSALSLPPQESIFEKMEALSKLSGVPVPAALMRLKDKPVCHFNVCEKDKMREEALSLLS